MKTNENFQLPFEKDNMFPSQLSNAHNEKTEITTYLGYNCWRIEKTKQSMYTLSRTRI